MDKYCDQAQLVNYVEYKALYEGANNQMWSQYAGILIWKSQGPWPALLSQLYDYYLQQTGGYYGVRRACEPHHVQLNLQTDEVYVVNTSRQPLESVSVSASVYALDGARTEVSPSEPPRLSVDPMSIAKAFKLTLPADAVFFLKLELRDAYNRLVSRNFYWLPQRADLSVLGLLKPALLQASVRLSPESPSDRWQFLVSLRNTGQTGRDPVAFRLLLQFTRPGTRERIVPVWYSDKYLCIAPQDEETLIVDVARDNLPDGEQPDLWLDGWNFAERRLWPSESG